MEKIPHYKSFRKHCMTWWNEIKEAWTAGERFFVIFFLGVVIALVIVISSVVVNAFNIVLPPLQKGWELVFEPKPPYPTKTFTYNLISRELDETGVHKTLFELFIYNPAGNTNNKADIEFRLPQVAECEIGSQTYELEIGTGVATTTDRRLIECRTEQPLIDNGNLFYVKEGPIETST